MITDNFSKPDILGIFNGYHSISIVNISIWDV